MVCGSFPVEAVSDGAADRDTLVLAALPLPAATGFLGCYGRGAGLGLVGTARTGLTVPRSSAGRCEGLNDRKSSP